MLAPAPRCLGRAFDGLGDFTIEMWIIDEPQPVSSGFWNVLSHNDGSSAGYVLYIDSGNYEAAIDKLIELAKRVGASLHGRFLFTPSNWFEFEDVALLCSRHDVPLDVRVLDRDGDVPLSTMSGRNRTSKKLPSGIIQQDWAPLIVLGPVAGGA